MGQEHSSLCAWSTLEMFSAIPMWLRGIGQASNGCAIYWGAMSVSCLGGSFPMCLTETGLYGQCTSINICVDHVFLLCAPPPKKRRMFTSTWSIWILSTYPPYSIITSCTMLMQSFFEHSYIIPVPSVWDSSTGGSSSFLKTHTHRENERGKERI